MTVGVVLEDPTTLQLSVPSDSFPAAWRWLSSADSNRSVLYEGTAQVGLHLGQNGLGYLSPTPSAVDAQGILILCR